MYPTGPDGLGPARTELVSYGNRLLADGLSVGSAQLQRARVPGAPGAAGDPLRDHRARGREPAAPLRDAQGGPVMTGHPRDAHGTPAPSIGPLGPVTVLGAHILDVLGRPVEAIPAGQGSARLTEIRATAAGTAAGTGVDLAKLGASVFAVGAIGDDLLGDMVIAAMARHGVDTTGLSRKSGVQTSATMLPIRGNGERPALHVPGATSLLELADVDLDRVRRSRALLIGAPDALGGIVGDGLAQVVAAARAGGALIAVDVLHPGRPQDLERIAGLLGAADWFLPNDDQLLALTGRGDLASAIADVLALGAGGVAVTCGADGCVIAWRGGGAPVPLPAIKVDVVDTTGCGDGFTAGLLAALLVGAGPVDAAWLGIACGSLVATGLGSDAGIESLGQALDFLGRSRPSVAERIAVATARRARQQAKERIHD